MLDEHEMIQGILNGDEKAFQQLYHEHASRVYNTSLSILQHQQEAEDVTQEVFIEIHASLASFKFKSSLSTWIYSITIRTCYVYLKKQRTQKRFAFFTSLFNEENELAHDQAHFEHPGIILENKEHGKVLFNALQKIPTQQKVAFTLVKIEGLNYKEAAEAMQVSVSALESLLTRANKNLKTCISDYYKINFKSSAGNFPIWLLM
jgi:RNA polymerase sigma-70 factor (ECF subfamily)